MSFDIRYFDNSMFVSEVLLGFIPPPGQDSTTLDSANTEKQQLTRTE